MDDDDDEALVTNTEKKNVEKNLIPCQISTMIEEKKREEKVEA